MHEAQRMPGVRGRWIAVVPRGRAYKKVREAKDRRPSALRTIFHLPQVVFQPRDALGLLLRKPFDRIGKYPTTANRGKLVRIANENKAAHLSPIDCPDQAGH